MSVDSVPVVTPTPATIKPTSPRDTIPNPTLIDFVLSLRNNIDGNPHPTSFEKTAIAIINPAMNNTSQIRELYIAKNSTIDSKYVDSIVGNLDYDKRIDSDISTEEKVQYAAKKNLLGNLKWIVLEYDNLRVLKIYESDKIIFVLINSNTLLEHTVDNILGYYYELDEVPKSLF